MGTDGGTASCSTSTDDGQCIQCLGAHCCTALEACAPSNSATLAATDCQNLSSCENACTNSSCLSSCENSFPAGVAPLIALSSCETSDCPVCSELGVGDPCVAQGTACLAGLSCSALWCTKACLHASDCEGLGAAGGNALGFANACIRTTSNGNQCSPGCAADSNCESFPGTYCLATTSVDGLSVSVCVSPPDAGGD